MIGVVLKFCFRLVGNLYVYICLRFFVFDVLICLSGECEWLL